jgi:hypothetical protein
MPVSVGDVNLVQGNLVQRSGVVLDDAGTVYLLSVLANGENELLRISRENAVKQLILYRGWPYIVDTKGRLFSLDVSWQQALRQKLPYIFMRMIKTLPLAAAAGAGSWALTMFDQNFTGFISMSAFQQPSVAFLSGIMLYYGLDLTRTVFFKKPRAIGEGGNYFTQKLGEGVVNIEEDQNYDDYVVTFKKKRKRKADQFLSLMAPAIADSRCIEALIRMNMR